MRILMLIGVVMLACIQARATDLGITLSYFLANPTANRTVVLQPMNPFPGNLIFLTSDTNGMAYLSNAPTGLINGEIKAPPGKIVFQLYITGPNLGFIDASNCLATGQASTYPAGQTAWAIATSDLRYALNGSSASNTFYPLFSNPSNYVQIGTLQIATNGLATVQYVNDSTNLLSNSLSNNIIQATNGLYLVLSQQIINATNPIPAQILAAATAVTNNPAITFFGTNVYTGFSVVGGEIVPTVTASGISGAITIDSQTNGFGSIVFFNSTDYATTNQLASAIAGVPTFGVTNGFASTQDVANAVAGLASTNYVNTATNGFITSLALIPYTPTLILNTQFAPLASTNYVRASTNGFIGQADIANLATTNYVNTATNTYNFTLTNLAGQLISITNQATLYQITNFFGGAELAKFNNTNQMIAAAAFGTPSVNTIFFTAGVNVFVSGTGVYYFFDGANWNMWNPVTLTLYQLGGLSPIGNTFTVANGANPAGFTFYTNAPTSQHTVTVISNTVLNVQAGGVVSGPISNLNFSLTGTNAIIAIAQSVSTNGGGATNVFIAAGAGIVVVTNAPSFWTISATGGSGTNGGSATNVFFAPGQNTKWRLLAGSNVVDVVGTLTNDTSGNAASATVASGLKSATTTVVVSGATAPSSGQVLTATSSTAATWQNSAGGGNGTNFLVSNVNALAGLIATNLSVSPPTLTIGTNAQASVLQGTTDPNGSVTAFKGQYYSRFDSSGNFLYLQINTNGATGWQ